jgi:hypothetical protein
MQIALCKCAFEISHEIGITLFQKLACSMRQRIEIIEKLYWKYVNVGSADSLRIDCAYLYANAGEKKRVIYFRAMR